MKLCNSFIVAMLVLGVWSCRNDDDQIILDDNETTVEELELGQLTLTGPADDEQLVPVQPLLTWEAFDSNEEVIYTITLGTSLDNLDMLNNNWDNVDYLFGVDNDLTLETATTYYWKVTANIENEAVAESDVRSFTTETINPIKITDNADFGARKAAGIEVFNDKIWVIGGLNESDEPFNDIWSSTDGENWIMEGTLSFGGIFGHELIAFNGKLWIYGGIFDGFQSNKIFSSDNGVDWAEEAETTPFVQYQASKFTKLGARIYRIAGYSAESDDFSPERYVYSSPDGLNWDLETENHGFETKFSFLIENLDDRLFAVEPNPDNDIEEIKTRTSSDGISWSEPVVSNLRERGINSVRSTNISDKIILMTTPESGVVGAATFFETTNGEVWQPASSTSSISIEAIHYKVVNLNEVLFAIGGNVRSNFSSTNNTVWKLN